MSPLMPKETLGDLIREGLAATGMNNSELARRVEVSPTYIGNLLRDVSPSAKSGQPRPSPEVVDRIAHHLGLPIDRARLAAGYAPAQQDASLYDLELERIAFYYKGLPRECQLDFLAMTESLWRRRRAEGRAEQNVRKGTGKHRPQTVKPGVEKPDKRRRA
jgi:transcriptional regulator with XRE-family HTH domain